MGNKIEDHKQLFRMSPEIWKFTNFEDVVETYTDMREMKLDRSPFPKFAIEAKLKFFKHMMGDDGPRVIENVQNCSVLAEYEMETLADGEENPCGLKITLINDNGFILANRIDLIELFRQKKRSSVFKSSGDVNWEKDTGLHEDLLNIAFDMRMVLLVMLATRNVKQEMIVNRGLMSGRSNKKNDYRKDYPITTTIGIGKITETHTGDSDDPHTVRPHLRRGHIRTQRFGPDLAFEKKVFIEPVFVNASQGWIAKRAAYNVSGKAWSDLRANAS